MARHSLIPAGSGMFSSDPFTSLQRSMNRLFEDVMQGNLPSAARADEAGTVMPQINVSETEKEIRVTAEMPGVTEKDIDITLDDGVLTIRGEKKMEKKEDKENFHYVERSFGQFQRSLRVPNSINPDQVQARVENGVLTVTLPKNMAQEKTRHIEVKGGGTPH